MTTALIYLKPKYWIWAVKCLQCLIHQSCELYILTNSSQSFRLLQQIWLKVQFIFVVHYTDIIKIQFYLNELFHYEIVYQNQLNQYIMILKMLNVKKELFSYVIIAYWYSLWIIFKINWIVEGNKIGLTHIFCRRRELFPKWLLDRYLRTYLLFHPLWSVLHKNGLLTNSFILNKYTITANWI